MEEVDPTSLRSIILHDRAVADILIAVAVFTFQEANTSCSFSQRL
jgi:hypothetical protein